MADFSWQITRGETDFISITITDKASGLPKDITGASIYFTVKKTESFLEPPLVHYVITTHTDAVNGLSRVSLSSVDSFQEPGIYLYDIVIIFANGERKEIVPISFLTIVGTLQGVVM